MIATLTFDTTGNGHGLYTEAIPLQSIGDLDISRATEIEFNHTAQQWEVMDRRDKVLFANPSRSVCLAWEHQHFS
jgi:hypothetical protein